MPVNDYRQEQEQNGFNAQQQQGRRSNSFGFSTGLNLQAPTGSLPSGPQAGSMGPRQAPNWGGQPNYGFGPTNYGAGSSSGRSTMPSTSGGTSSFGQAWSGAGGGAQQSITSPAGSRALRRGVNQNMTTGSYNTDASRNYNINFGDENIGNVNTGGGDILGTGAQQDKRTQTAVQQYNMGGAQGGNQESTASSVQSQQGGSPAVAKTRAPRRDPSTISADERAKMDKKNEGARNRRAAAKASAAGGDNNATSTVKSGNNAQTNTGANVTGNTFGGINFGDSNFSSPKGTNPAGQTNVASGNRTNVQKGRTNTITQSPSNSTTTNTTNNNNAPAPAGAGLGTTAPAQTPATPAPAKTTAPRKSGSPKKAAASPAATPAPAATPSPAASATSTPAPAPAASKPAPQKAKPAPAKQAPKAEAKPKAEPAKEAPAKKAPPKKAPAKSGKPKAEAPKA